MIDGTFLRCSEVAVPFLDLAGYCQVMGRNWSLLFCLAMVLNTVSFFPYSFPAVLLLRFTPLHFMCLLLQVIQVIRARLLIPHIFTSVVQGTFWSICVIQEAWRWRQLKVQFQKSRRRLPLRKCNISPWVVSSEAETWQSVPLVQHPGGPGMSWIKSKHPKPTSTALGF